jgi:hypothetical protein
MALKHQESSSKTEGMPIDLLLLGSEVQGLQFLFVSGIKIENLRELTDLFLANFVECLRESTESYTVQWKKFIIFS